MVALQRNQYTVHPMLTPGLARFFTPSAMDEDEDQRQSSSIFPPLASDRIERLLEDEMNTFTSAFSVQPVPEVQDLRAALIAWFAVFLPEAVPATFVQKLQEFVVEVRSHPDFTTRGWYRTLFLDVALFALQNDMEYLDICRRNFAHGTRALRIAVMEALAFVADRLSFSDQLLREGAERNLDTVHCSCEWSTALYMTARASAAEKRAWLKNWLSLEKFMNTDQEHTLRQLADGDFVPNPVFLEFFNYVQQYVSVRLACTLPDLYVQGTLLDLPEKQLALDLQTEPPNLGGLLWQRLRKLPLMGVCLQIVDQTEN